MTTDANVPDADAQDFAEVFDETNLTEDGDEIANADDLPDLYDATRALGDGRDVEALDADDVDPDELDDDDLEEDPDDDNQLRDDLEDEPEGADSDDVLDEKQQRQDELLDEGVEETFPASDPVSVKRIT